MTPLPTPLPYDTPPYPTLPLTPPTYGNPNPNI